MNRPEPDYTEMALIRQRSQLASHVAFLLHNMANVGYQNSVLQGVNVYGVTEEHNEIQPITIQYGRYISASEFTSGSDVVIMGYDNAADLFGDAGDALGKEITVNGRKSQIIGIIKKIGQNLIGWDYDRSIMLPYRFCRQIFEEKSSEPVIMVMGKEGVTSDALKDELTL